MTKVNVISGFLGAGKTTLIKKLLDEALKGEKLVFDGWAWDNIFKNRAPPDRR